MSQCVACLFCRCDKDIKVSYTVYNRLSVLLKSLLAITRVTPAYKLSRKQGHDYVILYRWVDSTCLVKQMPHYTTPWSIKWHTSPPVSVSLVSRIYFGEVQLSGLGEGNCKLLYWHVVNHWKQDWGLTAPDLRILLLTLQNVPNMCNQIHCIILAELHVHWRLLFCF